MQVEVLSRFFLCDEKGDLLGVGRIYFFADEDIGERLIVIEDSTVGIDKKKIIIEFFGHIG